jgi:hypothetical protein
MVSPKAILEPFQNVGLDLPYRVLASIGGMALFFNGAEPPLDTLKNVSAWLGTDEQRGIDAVAQWVNAPGRREGLTTVATAMLLFGLIAAIAYAHDHVSPGDTRAMATAVLGLTLLSQVDPASRRGTLIPLLVLTALALFVLRRRGEFDGDSLGILFLDAVAAVFWAVIAPLVWALFRPAQRS